MKLVQSIRLPGFSRLIQVARFSSSSESSPHDDMFDVLETETEKDFGFDEWLKSTKSALAESKGKYWLGKNGVSFNIFYSNFYSRLFSPFLIINRSSLDQFCLMQPRLKYSSHSSKTRRPMIIVPCRTSSKFLLNASRQSFDKRSLN